MKVSKTDNRFKTGFLKPITGLPQKTDKIPKNNAELITQKVTYDSFCNGGSQM